MYKKYSNLLDNNKYELEELSPLDFVNYILKNITSYKFSIYKSSNLEVTIPYENPNQIYNFFYNKYDISNFCINFIEDLVNKWLFMKTQNNEIDLIDGRFIGTKNINNKLINDNQK